MTKRLILVRHAHRDTSDRALDNGLSPKGETQAAGLLKVFRKRFGKSRARVLSSPKRRCVETLRPTARHAGTFVRRDLRLDEQNPDESDLQFLRRVEAFCEWWKDEGPDLLVVCSHGDWLPLAVELLTGRVVDLKKSGFVELTFDRLSGVRLRRIVQRPRG